MSTVALIEFVPQKVWYLVPGCDYTCMTWASARGIWVEARYFDIKMETGRKGERKRSILWSKPTFMFATYLSNPLFTLFFRLFDCFISIDLIAVKFVLLFGISWDLSFSLDLKMLNSQYNCTFVISYRPWIMAFLLLLNILGCWILISIICQLL